MVCQEQTLFVDFCETAAQGEKTLVTHDVGDFCGVSLYFPILHVDLYCTYVIQRLYTRGLWKKHGRATEEDHQRICMAPNPIRLHGVISADD